MNRFFLLLCLLFCAKILSFSQCYLPTFNDGVTCYDKKQYQQALACFKAAKLCDDQPAVNELDKWITNCNAKIKEHDTKSNSQRTSTEKYKEPEPCFMPNLMAAHVSFSNHNFFDAKELFIMARACPDLPADNELARWIDKCDDGIDFLNCIKENYTSFYNKGNDLFKKENFDEAKQNFLRAKQSTCIPHNADVDTKIRACEQKINEIRFNTLQQDTIKFTLWDQDGIFIGSAQYDQPNGEGILTFTKGQPLKSIESDFKNGEPSGFTHCIFNNGDEFTGMIKGAGFETGTFKYAHGDIYEGAFLHREPNGEGKMLYANGDTYEGNFANGKKEGAGKLVVKLGNHINNAQGANRYEGNWIANQKSGFGQCFDDKEALIHEGVFTDDFPEGDYPNRLMRISFNWVKVPEGLFTMGCTSARDCADKDRPSHVVSLSEFYISDKEVTVAQYRIFCEMTGRSMPPKPFWGWEDDNPMVNVTWNDAVSFCQWCNCRLPTEAEWEYAAQSAKEPREKLYSGSNELREVAYFQDNATRTRAVGKRKPNELFIFDMSGNVSEWVQDWLGTYPQSLQLNPKGPSYGTHKVVRGGSWRNSEMECRITCRSGTEPNLCTNDIGFRVVRNW